MRNNHLGYCNKRRGSDVESFELFSENGKTYAVEVKKVQACVPQFEVGGFCGHCYNQAEVWGGSQTEEIGKPFEVKLTRSGEYGRMVVAWSLCAVMTGADFNARFEGMKAAHLEHSFMANSDKDRHAVYVVENTKRGTPKKVLEKIGKLEATCRYFFDYNF
jgi:hypothetical protein